MSVPEAVPEVLPEKHVGSGKVTEDDLKQYLELDKVIHQNAKVALVYKTKERELNGLNDQLNTAKHKLTDLEQEVAKEYAEFKHAENPSVQAMLAQQGQNASAVLSKEQHEYMEALNRKEMCQMEIAGIESKISELKSSMKEYEDAAKLVESAYEKQEEILAEIFDGEYGSEKEEHLESSLDNIHVRRYRIHLADYNWRYARKFLYHAVVQMSVGLRRWIDLTRIPYSSQMNQLRYQVVNEARANFIAASQNFHATQNILSHIEFPYCKPSEIVTLDTAIQYIFTDMLTNQRYQHAFQCYNSVHLRSAALLQWVDKVITEAILVDLQTTDNEFKSTKRSLRVERINLISAKMKEVLGIEVDTERLIANAEAADDDDTVSPLEAHGQKDGSEDVFKVTEPEGGAELDSAVQQAANSNVPADPLSEMAQNEGGNPVLDAGVAAVALAAISKPDAEPPKRPLHEIAEKPSNEIIFGNTDRMFAEFGVVVETQQKTQNSERAQMQQGLQRKLAERKARKERLMNKTG